MDNGTKNNKKPLTYFLYTSLCVTVTTTRTIALKAQENK